MKPTLSLRKSDDPTEVHLDTTLLTEGHPLFEGEGSPPNEFSLFKNRRIGSFEILFVVDGEVVSKKKAHGFLSLKPRKGTLQTQHFVLRSDTTLPSKKVLLREIELVYSKTKDCKVVQVHLDKRDFV